MSALATAAVVAALLGSALIGGVFFAFSNFVMKALARLPTPTGVAAMQSINRVVLNPLFLGSFAGTALLSVLIGALALVGWGSPAAAYWLAGALSYLVGTFALTGLGNVPLNNGLAGLAPTGPAAAAAWPRYLDRWTRLNTLRTCAALLAALLFSAGLVQPAP